MKPVLHLICKSFMLLVVVAAMQVAVFERFHRTEPLKKFEQCLKARPDVILFGDSCNGWVDQEDTDRRAISELLNDRLVGKTVGRIDGRAYHLELYEAFIDLLIARQAHPELLIIPINLRSFSSEWDARPSYAFEAAKQQLRQADDPFALAISPLLKTLQWQTDTAKSLSAFKRTEVFDGDQRVGTVDDFENARYDHPSEELVRSKFIYHYMYSLTPEHRKLVALRNIVRKAAEHQLQVAFYVTPVDFESGSRCLGNRFASQIKHNVSVLRASVAGSSASFMDCSLSLDANAFSWSQYPNEHLTEVGRNFVAETLASNFSARCAMRLTHTNLVLTK
jgi:hypothetical protein